MVNKATASCLQCKKEFEYIVGHTYGKFCCRKCYDEFVAIPKKECKLCGNLYTPDKGNKEKWDRSKYCSLECLNKSKFKGRYMECILCKKSFWIHPSQFDKRKFCSKLCFNLSKKGKSNFKNYKKGYRAEYEAKKYLESLGYEVVRNFLSWGVWDLCAIGTDHIRYIQVKSSRKHNTSYSKAIKELIGYSNPDFSTKELWTRIDRFGWKKYIINNNTIEKLDENNLLVNKLDCNRIILISESPSKVERKVNNFIILIDQKLKSIEFIQCTPENVSNNAKDKIAKDLSWLNDEFMCRFEVK